MQFSGGNPGAILAMLKMAGYPKYRSNAHIKITPLYIDFRMNWDPAGSPLQGGPQHLAKQNTRGRTPRQALYLMTIMKAFLASGIQVTNGVPGS